SKIGVNEYLICWHCNPRWASINRGVLICDECCSIHRGLGRHSSQVRHLTHTAWPPSQLQTVQMLYSNGANSIWEHCLLDPSSIMSGKRKANPQDRVHPNKTEFIKAKYQMLAFVHRMPCREDDSVTAKDLSKQLHSSVRTGNLETCLRLLSLGAQANFFHPEKGNTPLHVAAKAGQLLQAELLTVYGADPGAPDSSGNTPIDYARQAGHQELADRLVEIQFELTDRLAFYLCGRRPDHKNGQHFIIPQIADRYGLKIKRLLLQLSNHQFEELAMDVYDEVDRRETDAVWLATQNHSTLVTETTVVPFLPVNPEYSSTRNQGRQKLARFNAHEFATLVIDILTDARRRQQGSSPDHAKDNVELILKDIGSRHGSENQEADQPDYDSVASDEDTEREPASGKDERTKLNSLQTENSTLRWQGANTPAQPQEPQRRALARGGRAMSMYETGSGLKHYPPRADSTHHGPGGLMLQPLPPNIGKGPSVAASCSLPAFPSSSSWAWDERVQRVNETCGIDIAFLHTACTSPRPVSIPRAGGRLGEGAIPELGDLDECESDPTLPSTEDVISKTEQITKNIQELLRAAQENKHDSFIPCSERIYQAVTEMAALFPKRPSSETVRDSLRLLTSSASRLQGECHRAMPPDSCPADTQLVTQQLIQCAYDIAKAAKQLVTVTTKESD
uniref:Arf-GAP domain-containing protein n=1 Tax=Electrophorus electricus TaxID=8005 RepID=A0A4W4FL40_ELEEL